MAEKLSLISVDNQPIPGTNLYRRWQDEHEIVPEYRGDAQNETIAIEQAIAAGLNMVSYLDILYVMFGGEWYCWSFPWSDSTSL